jgi:hypothetical protein
MAAAQISIKSVFGHSLGRLPLVFLAKMWYPK